MDLPFVTESECNNLAIVFLNEFFKTCRVKQEPDAIRAATCLKQACDLFFDQCRSSQNQEDLPVNNAIDDSLERTNVKTKPVRKRPKPKEDIKEVLQNE